MNFRYSASSTVRTCSCCSESVTRAWQQCSVYPVHILEAGNFNLTQQVILPTSTQCDTLLYPAWRSTILNSGIPWMSRVSRLANQLTAGSQQSLLVSVGMIDQIDMYKLSISHWCHCVPSSLNGGHYMITGRHDEIRYNTLSKMRDSQLVYIIHLATETGNCTWQMNKRSILRDLLWHIFKSETSNEVWISDTPHIDRITDCSTRYGQVALAWDWPREDGNFA